MLLWCLHCQRTFKRGTERTFYDAEVGAEVSRCHYEDCDGSELTGTGTGDFWDWQKVRTSYERDPDRGYYPDIPIHGKEYPLYSNETKD